MKLYDVSEELHNVQMLLEEQPDAPGLNEALAEIKEDMAVKVANIGVLLKNMDADCVALKAEEDALKERRLVKENAIERIKAYVLANADTTQKYESPRAVISFRKSQGVVVTAQELLPQEFFRTKVIQEVDKAKLKEVLKEKAVPGAVLENRLNVTVK